MHLFLHEAHLSPRELRNVRRHFSAAPGVLAHSSVARKSAAARQGTSTHTHKGAPAQGMRAEPK